jgi:PAS domain S-box-containing protein
VVENVIEAMVDAVLVIDVEGRITLANTAATRVSGYTLEELRSRPVSQLLSDDSSGLRTVVRRRIQEGEALRREDSWLITKSQDKIPVSITGAAVVDAAGTLQGIVLVARDIREVRQLLADKEAEIARRRKAEDELRAANASIEEKLEAARTQLLLAERRATLGTLAGGVGHELRNIAQIQTAAIDELVEALDAGEDVRGQLRRVLNDLERVGQHITAHGQRLMQLARPGPDHVAPLALEDVVQDVISMLRGAGRLRHCEVTVEHGHEPVRVTVNRTRIEQILVNLVVNAVESIGDSRGKIAIAIRPTSDGKRVICEVTDSGPGIAPEVIDTVFQAFFTTKAEGTGLGLSVARGIVESYGGELTVRSIPGTATTFRFDLPR